MSLPLNTASNRAFVSELGYRRRVAGKHQGETHMYLKTLGMAAIGLAILTTPVLAQGTSSGPKQDQQKTNMDKEKMHQKSGMKQDENMKSNSSGPAQTK
jgi:hypothetical protein